MQVDPETIRKAQAGDDIAFGEIVRVYKKRILGTIYRLVGKPEEVEDVGQDVFVRLYQSLGQLRSVEVFEPWLYRLTTNAAYDHLRRRKRKADVRMADLSEEQVLAADAVAGGKSLKEEKEHQEVRELVTVMLDEISEEDRILLTLKEVQGLSLKELAEIYDVKENALKVRLFRARKRALKAYERLEMRGEV